MVGRDRQDNFRNAVLVDGIDVSLHAILDRADLLALRNVSDTAMSLDDHMQRHVERRLMVMYADEVRLQRNDPPINGDKRDFAAYLLDKSVVTPVGVGVQNHPSKTVLQSVTQVRGLAECIFFLAPDLPQPEKDCMMTGIGELGSCPRRYAGETLLYVPTPRDQAT